MTSAMHKLRQFLATAEPLALVEIAAAKGSTPREKGAFMLVSRVAILGTIGGGQLEYMAIDKARQMLVLFPSRAREITLSIPLGPEIGQCCGGRVEVLLRRVDPSLAEELVTTTQTEEEQRPHFYIFGGGHVGRALAAATALLPVKIVVVETRADELKDMPEGVEARLTSMPDSVVRDAPSGSAFAVLTHDHALDFLIVAEALKRDDTAYVGMIGSRTKKATFRNWFFKNAAGTQTEFARLVSPIGGETVKDKRPEVIAALAAAEVMTALAMHSEANTDTPSVKAFAR